MMHMFHRDAVASPALRPGSLRPGVRSLRARLGQNSLCRSGAGGQMTSCSLASVSGCFLVTQQREIDMK